MIVTNESFPVPLLIVLSQQQQTLCPCPCFGALQTGNRVDCAIGFGSRQRSLPVWHSQSNLALLWKPLLRQWGFCLCGSWEQVFTLGSQTPTLHQSSAVVGSRELDEKTEQEIKALFNLTFCLPENIKQLRVELENFHLWQSWNV